MSSAVAAVVTQGRFASSSGGCPTPLAAVATVHHPYLQLRVLDIRNSPQWRQFWLQWRLINRHPQIAAV